MHRRQALQIALGSFLGLVTRTAVKADEVPLARPCYCLDQLAGMSWCELEALYRQACPGNVPCGFVHGRAIYCPCKKGSKRKAKIAKFVWKGKIFECGSMINQWRGIRAIRANVYEAESWLDGKPSIILDYSCTSKVWQDVRDEIREICPGVWLGVMYLRSCPDKIDTFFALEAPCK